MMADLGTHVFSSALSVLLCQLLRQPHARIPQHHPMPTAAHTTIADAQDAAWLRAAGQGEREAFAALYRRHHSRLARFLRRFTARRELIDEVINDTLWVVWQKAAGFRGDSKVSTWIIGIAYRCMLKALRNGAPAEEIGEGLLNTQELAQAATWHDGGAPDSAHHTELQDWLARGLTTLPEDQRVTLELAYFMGCSCEEIAVVMGCAVGTVKARMFHARVRLRNVMPMLAGERDAAQG
jgi:RNA polymerase sigma-70 factor, ECF subfamily